MNATSITDSFIPAPLLPPVNRIKGRTSPGHIGELFSFDLDVPRSSVVSAVVTTKRSKLIVPTGRRTPDLKL